MEVEQEKSTSNEILVVFKFKKCWMEWNEMSFLFLNLLIQFLDKVLPRVLYEFNLEWKVKKKIKVTEPNQKEPTEILLWVIISPPSKLTATCTSREKGKFPFLYPFIYFLKKSKKTSKSIWFFSFSWWSSSCRRHHRHLCHDSLGQYFPCLYILDIQTHMPCSHDFCCWCDSLPGRIA